jgi:hypothetical protein
MKVSAMNKPSNEAFTRFARKSAEHTFAQDAELKARMMVMTRRRAGSLARARFPRDVTQTPYRLRVWSREFWKFSVDAPSVPDKLLLDKEALPFQELQP